MIPLDPHMDYIPKNVLLFCAPHPLPNESPTHLSPLVIQTLARTLHLTADDIQIDITPYGKPLLRHASCFFNLSTSGAHLWLAISHILPVGLDIEMRHADPPMQPQECRAFADFILTPSEARWFQQQPEDQHTDLLRHIWVQKEAVMKADGRGIAIPPCAIELSIPLLDGAHEGAATLIHQCATTLWHIYNISTPILHAAVCVPES